MMSTRLRQQTFADRVQQIEALKQQMMASLAELEQGFHAMGTQCAPNEILLRLLTEITIVNNPLK